MFHLIYPPEFSRFIGQCGLTRSGLIRFLNTFSNELETIAPERRRQRSQDDPDLFLFRVPFLDANRYHLFTFWINDVQASDHLFLVAFEHVIVPPLQ